MLVDEGFDFAQFNAETPDFYLVINPTQEFDLAVGKVAD
jgi:hypothetical protein